MRTCVRKSDGKILEAQSGHALDQTDDFAALRQNVIATRGYTEDQVEFVHLDEAEVQARIAVQNEARLTYDERRRREYPPIGDQLDALWKGGADAETMRERVMAVKAAHPKS